MPPGSGTSTDLNGIDLAVFLSECIARVMGPLSAGATREAMSIRCEDPSARSAVDDESESFMNTLA